MGGGGKMHIFTVFLRNKNSTHKLIKIILQFLNFNPFYLNLTINVKCFCAVDNDCCFTFCHPIITLSFIDIRCLIIALAH